MIVRAIALDINTFFIVVVKSVDCGNFSELDANKKTCLTINLK